jgi:3-hydroxyacyl-[acyl-carrier-protein] dehydratase
MLTISHREHSDGRPEGVPVGGKMDSGLFYLASCDRVKFRRQVTPGDRLDLAAELAHAGSHAWKVKVRASVEGGKAAEAQITAAF